jgi:hypothetical protein
VSTEDQNVVGGDVRVVIPALRLNINPLAFNYYASHYLQVARTVEITPRFSPVPYYLYCRSLELSLKAFLLLKGLSKNVIRKKPYSHNLETILLKAKELGLGSYVIVSEEERLELLKANDYYNVKDFEYANTMKVVCGYPDLPNLIVLENLAARLVSDLESACLEA